jgi:hypothetical protein
MKSFVCRPSPRIVSGNRYCLYLSLLIFRLAVGWWHSDGSQKWGNRLVLNDVPIIFTNVFYTLICIYNKILLKTTVHYFLCISSWRWCFYITFIACVFNRNKNIWNILGFLCWVPYGIFLWVQMEVGSTIES